MLVSSTLDYRRLARSQVQACDGVLEIGCSYGVCSKMLQEHAAWLGAIDNSCEVVQEVRWVWNYGTTSSVCGGRCVESGTVYVMM
jgi:hypothetical protein